MHSRFAPRLVIMVKEPVAGRVKTRLARGVGTTVATSIYRQMVQALALRLGRDPRWHTLLAVAPDSAVRSRALPFGLVRMPQGAGDIGDRLERIFADAPPGPVLVIGTDIPGIHASDIAAGFGALAAHRAVIGPSQDGGFWLIGLTAAARRHARFAGVRWSTVYTRADTEALLERFDVGRVLARDDIDTAADLARHGNVIGRQIVPAGPSAGLTRQP